MPIIPVVGPAGGGKSQFVNRNQETGEVVIDFTLLYAALANVQRGPDGRYPERVAGDPLLPLVNAVKEFALRQAVDRQLNGYVTSSDAQAVSRLEALTGETAEIIDPGREAIELRLRDPETGVLSDECGRALSRWYRFA